MLGIVGYISVLTQIYNSSPLGFFATRFGYALPIFPLERIKDALQTSKDSVNFELKKPVGVEDPPTLDNLIKIYPNPVNEYITVKLGNIPVIKLITQIYSADGTLKDSEAFQEEGEKRVGIEKLSKGIYFLKITIYSLGGEVRMITKKFVKE